MKKFMIAPLVAFIALFAALMFMPSSAYSKLAPTEWHDRVNCTTNSTGHCTQVYGHNFGVVPVVQVTSEGLTALVHTYQVTSTTFRVRVMQNATTPWANRSLILAVSIFAPTTISPTPGPSVTRTTAEPSATSPSPSPSVTTNPPVVPDYPTKTTTGVPAGTTLTNYSGSNVITTANTLIENKKVNGNLDIRAAGVVIKNSEISGIVINDNISTHHAFTIQNSTVGPASGCSTWGNGAIGIENYTAKNVLVRGFGDGFRIAGSNILIQDSYVDLCTVDPNAHSDGIQAYGAANGTNIVIDHNVIDQRNVMDGTATSPIFIPNDTTSQGNQNITVTVTNNVLAGGGFSLRVFGDLPWSSPSISNNKIVDGSWVYGPTDVTCARIAVWKGNIVAKYDFAKGKITEQVRSLDDKC